MKAKTPYKTLLALMVSLSPATLWSMHEEGTPHISKGNLTHTHVGGNVTQNITTNTTAHYHTTSTVQLSESLQQLTHSLANQHKKIEGSFKEVRQSLGADIRQMTLVIGPTGYGKSTFLTWLGARTPLQTVKKGRQLFLQAQEEDLLIISHDKTTGTYYPTPVVYQNPLVGEMEVFCDCPGFGDVRGAFSDIVHMAALGDVKRRAQHLKVLLLLSGNTLEETREGGLLETLNQMCSLFFSTNEQDTMGALVLTKTQAGEETSYLADLSTYANDETNLLTTRTRQWLRGYLQKADQHVLFMPLPEGVGPYAYSAIETWQKLTALSAFANPVFYPVLTPQSRDKIDEVADKMNQQVSHLMKENTPQFVDNFVYKLKNHPWSHHALLSFIREGRTYFSFQNQPTTQKEWALRIIATLPDLTPHLQAQLLGSIEQIDILRNLLSSSSTREIYFDTNQWIDSFHYLRRYLENVWLAVQTSFTNRKEIDYGSFNSSGEGKTQEQLTFPLKSEDPWQGFVIQTLDDIPTFKRQSYHFKDDQLHSIPLDHYILHRQGFENPSGEVIEEKQHAPIAYREVNRVVTPQHFDVKKALRVNLDVQKDYERADQSIYIDQTHVKQHPVQEMKTYFTHHDETLQSQEMGEYQTFYEGQHIALGTHEKRRESYSLHEIEVKANSSTFTSPYPKADLIVLRSFKRLDKSIYQQEEKVKAHRVTSLPAYFDHHDEEFYSQEMIPYEVVYEGQKVKLPPQLNQRIDYVKEQTHVEPLQETFNATELSIDLTVIDAYKRGDATMYSHYQTIKKHKIQALPLILTHEDNLLCSKEIQPYSTAYGHQIITLPSLEVNQIPYRMQQKRHEVKISELRIRNSVVQNEDITVILRQDYQRSDNSIYTLVSEEKHPVLHEETLNKERGKKVTTYYVEYARQKTVLSTYEEDYSVVPHFARGYEAIYNRFINGKLIFDNKNGQQKEFSFNAFADTLTGEFDLSGLRYKYDGKMYDVNEDLRIKVGVRTAKENEGKTTIWFTPKFMVDALRSHPWKGVNWSADVGIFWSWGMYELTNRAYLTTMRFDEISSKNLLNLYGDVEGRWYRLGRCWYKVLHCFLAKF